MEQVLYFDYCALLILLVILISIYVKNMNTGSLNKYFKLILLCLLFTSFSDVFAVEYDRRLMSHVVERYIFHMLYLICHCFSVPLYAKYALRLSNLDQGITRKFNLIFYTPIVILSILILTSPLNHYMFYFNEAGIYTRGKLFPVMYVVTGFYVVMGLGFLIRYRTLLDEVRYISLMMALSTIIAATVIQFLLKGILIEMFANSISLLFVFLMVQRTEEINDVDLGLLKKKVFFHDISNIQSLENDCELVIVSTTNFKKLRNTLSYSSMGELLKCMSSTILTECHKFRIRMEQYYLEEGKFAVLIREKVDKKDYLEELALHLNSIFKNDIIINDMPISILCSVCVIKFPEDIDDVAYLTRFIDDLNSYGYKGKVVHASDIYSKNKYDIMSNIDIILEDALKNRKLMVYYQPIYDTKSEKYRSAEALLRLKDERFGFIPPDVFIAAAEKSGAIHRVGSYVLEEVCKFMSEDEFKDLGLDYIEVNLSAVECMQSNLITKVLPVLDQYHVEADKVNLEITETAVGDMESVIEKNVDELNDSGIKFSLDDYGTGYSNITRIAKLPFSLIKIDKSLTTSVFNPNMRIVVENTVHMIKDLDMKIVVEGVETEELAKYFTNLKCDYIQGFYYCKPLPKDEFIKFIKDAA